MPEIPKDPMQAVAYARVVAAELAADALQQATACGQGANTLDRLATTLGQVADLLGAELGDKATALVTALASIAKGVQAVGVGVEHAKERFQAHAEGWAREEQVWQRIMEPVPPPAAPAPPEVKP